MIVVRYVVSVCVEKGLKCRCPLMRSFASATRRRCVTKSVACPQRCCATASPASQSARQSTTTPVPQKDFWKQVSVPKFEQWLRSSGIRLEDFGVALALDPTGARGLVATRPFREGVTVLSVPMSTFALSAASLLEKSATIQRNLSAIPTFDDVRREMTVFSVRDPILLQQMYLAILLAAERYEAAVVPNSSAAKLYGPYFDVLPHPAVNDTVVMGMHKDVLDPMQLMEWDDHQRVFLTVCRHLHEVWVARSKSSSAAAYSGDRSSSSRASGGGGAAPSVVVPPVEVLYWAFRTVISRMHLLPDRGLAPPASHTTPTNRTLTLNYESYAALKAISENESFFQRSVSKFKGLFGTREDRDVGLGASDFRLVPTLVPLIDFCGHVSSSNVSVEVQPRPEVGSCVELQAVSPIAKGETIGMCLNRSQSIAFTLYRFGFLPV